MEIVEPLVAIVATMEVDFLTVHRSRVIVATRGFLTEGLGLAAADQIVEVQHVEVVQSLLTVPATEDVQVVADFVAGVRSPARGRVVLGNGREPSHLSLMRYLFI